MHTAEKSLKRSDKLVSEHLYVSSGTTAEKSEQQTAVTNMRSIGSESERDILVLSIVEGQRALSRDHLTTPQVS